MSNPTELPDLDRLEALARAATPGPWTYFPKPKYSEHHVSLPIEGAGMRRALFDDGCRTDRPEADAQFIAAANPAAVLALIALARRAQPEGEAPQAEPLSEAQLDRIARSYFSEQWAVQHVKDAIHDAFLEAGKSTPAAQQAVPDAYRKVLGMPEGPAVIGPAAQHAESGALADKPDEHGLYLDWAFRKPGAPLSEMHGSEAAYEAWRARAALAAQSQGAQVAIVDSRGCDALRSIRDLAALDASAGAGEYYRIAENALAAIGLRDAKPRAALAAKAEAPAPGDLALLAALADAADVFMKGGVAPLRPLIDRAKAVTSRAQQAAAPGALDPNVFFDALSDFKDSRMTADDAQEFFDKLAAPSAPGTPEAPKGGA